MTVAFNQPDLISMQAESLRQNFGNSYSYVVVDNSSSMLARDQIRGACDRVGASYVSLPTNPSRNPSRSHGYALNWVYRNVISLAEVEYVGLLDHDIFMIGDASYGEILAKHGAYGHFQCADPYYFFWPGLFFFSRSFFEGGVPNFLPVTRRGVYLDTGGGNWDRWYSKMDPSNFYVPLLEDVWAKDPTNYFDKTVESATLQADAFTLFDRKWVHLVNGSNWASVDLVSKLEWLTQFLEQQFKGSIDEESK